MNLLKERLTVPKAVPAYVWNKLALEDKEAYLKLKNSFENSSSTILCKEKDKSTFPTELEAIRAFIESKSTGIEERSIAVGIGFQPSFLSVNIQRLKTLLNRCKSSINKGFQQINYVSEKSQVKSHVIKSIPLLAFHPEEIRQWTIRIPNNGSNEVSNIFNQISFTPNSTDVFQNINLSNISLNDKPLFHALNHNNVLPTPLIETCMNNNSKNNISPFYEQNLKQKIYDSVSIQQQYIPENINIENYHTTPTIQNPPDIRLSNSQYIETNFSLDDFELNNGHEFNIRDYDSNLLCDSCCSNISYDNNNISFELSPNFHVDEIYTEYHKHDDPQDDDIGFNISSDHNGSSIDIRNNFS